MQSCKEKTTEIYLVLWLVRGVTTATKVHVLVGVEGGVAVRLAVQGLCETQYCAAVFIVNISIFFFQTSYPLPNIAVHLVYSMCEFFFLYYFYCLRSLSFFQFYQYFLVFFRYFIFLFFTCSSPMASHCMCRVVAWRQCGAPRPCHSAVDCLPLVHSLSLSFSLALCGLYQFSACRHSSH